MLKHNIIDKTFQYPLYMCNHLTLDTDSPCNLQKVLIRMLTLHR